MDVVSEMLELARVDEDDFVYDVGCGDGRILITAAQKYGASGVGIDIHPGWVEESRKNARESGVEDLVKFIRGDVTRANLSKATVVALYQQLTPNKILRPIFEKQLKPGTRVVSHNYPIPGWEEKTLVYVNSESGQTHSIFLYQIDGVMHNIPHYVG